MMAIGRMCLPRPGELLTYYDMEFHRSDDPPEASTLVLCTNGLNKVALGFYLPDVRPDADPPWFGVCFSKDPDYLGQAPEHLDWVKGWSYLPDLAECLADCYPDRACRVCGCTQDHGCPEGCSWVEWDLCSQCVGKETECQQK